MENKINIGELDTLVFLYNVVKTKGTQGELVKTFSEHSGVFAKVTRNVGEYIANENLEQSVDLLITIYKVSGLDTRWRVRVGNRMYEVTAIDPVSRISPLCEVSLHAID